MANLEESEENWVSTIDNLCSKLNIDATAAKKSKESFLEIKKHYTLEGDPLHWIACALYVACRSSLTPTVQPGMAVEGNCVSLTRLLRLCNVSLIQFFTKIKNWIEMASMPVTFKDRISRLEHKFAVSTVLFRKFHPIFQEIFTGLTNEPVKTNTKSKKHKLQPCSTNAVFEFSWVLYCCVKGEFHSSADDLVDMYHLLLSCLDFVFANAYMAQRTDLINPCLKVLPSDWLTNETPPKKPPCIIATLCELKHGLSVEAATMKEYSFRPVIKKFFEKELIKGDDEMLGVLDILNFDSNFKSLNNLYETYVLSVGEFDERIFLGEHANEQLGNSKKVSGDEISQVIANFGPSSRACPDTPLTGRKYLAHRAEELTPVSEATNSLARLGAYLRQTKPQPSPQMMRFFSDCGVSEETITSNVIEPCNAWTERFSQSLREIRCSNETIAIRKNMVTCLYYKIFEYILKEEHRKKPQVSLQMLLTQETYQLTVYACCTEIVLHAYSIHSLRFPTVLQIYGLSAFHFYKIIELIVQALVDKMSRDVIKHLNAVEEQVLESLVWTSESPLWEQLKKFPAPSSVEVCANESPNQRNASGLLSPVSAAMRYISPAAEQAKKQLFKDNIKPGQSLLVQSSMKPEAPATPPASSPAPPANAGAVDTTPVTPSTTPKKGNNSLMLFFRKFYSLAVVRMNDLCTRLNVSDEELKKKIWTCLEFSIMNQTQLLKDRHLDQLLMCAVYVICKVSNNANQQVERTFAEIMRCYRQRPLADNHVYRSVLIKPATEENQAERGDLIDFYNKVYVQCMQSFALRFTGRNKEECGLSPLPARRGARWSPGARRLCARHQLSVKPLTSPPPPQRRLTYRFSRSPAKDLHAINTMVCEVSAIKRALSPGGAGGAGIAAAALRGDKRARLAAPGVARKLQGLLQDRRPL